MMYVLADRPSISLFFIHHLLSLFYIGATRVLLSLLFSLHCLQNSKLVLCQLFTVLFLLLNYG